MRAYVFQRWGEGGVQPGTQAHSVPSRFREHPSSALILLPLTFPQHRLLERSLFKERDRCALTQHVSSETILKAVHQQEAF